MLLISDFSCGDGTGGGGDGEEELREEAEERQAEEEEEGDSGEGSEEDEDEDKEEEQDSDFDELDEENAGKKRGSSEKQVCDEAPCCTQPQVQVLACGMVGFIMSGACVFIPRRRLLCASVWAASVIQMNSQVSPTSWNTVSHVMRTL